MTKNYLIQKAAAQGKLAAQKIPSTGVPEGRGPPAFPLTGPGTQGLTVQESAVPMGDDDDDVQDITRETFPDDMLDDAGKG